MENKIIPLSEKEINDYIEGDVKGFYYEDVKKTINECLNEILEPLTHLEKPINRKELYKFQSQTFKKYFGDLIE